MWRVTATSITDFTSKSEAEDYADMMEALYEARVAIEETTDPNKKEEGSRNSGLARWNRA